MCSAYSVFTCLSRSCFYSVTITLSNFYFIQLGEEVTENYYPVFHIMPREVRQEFLKSHYCFECNCLACEKNYLTLSELKKSTILPWRCFECHGYFENGLCLDCQKKINVEEMIKKLDKIKKTIDENQIESASPSCNWKNTYAAFCKNMGKLTTILGPNCEIVVENEDFLRKLLPKLFGNKSNVS